MNRYPLWRYILIIVLFILGLVYALPNLYGEDPAVQVTAKDAAPMSADMTDKITQTLQSQHIDYKSIKKLPDSVIVRFKATESQLKAQDELSVALGNSYSVALNLVSRTPRWLLDLGANPMKLGLDLRGGVHFLLDVNAQSMVIAREKADINSIGQELRQQHIRYAGVVPQNNQIFLIRFRDGDSQNQALGYLQAHFPDYVFSPQTVDAEPVLQAKLQPQAIVKMKEYAVQQNLQILRSRVNELGIAEPVIQQQGANQISVDLPGVQDMARAKDLIGKMATIRLQLVDVEHNPATVAQTGIVPFGSSLYKDEYGNPILLKNQILLTGSSIINASPIFDENGKPAVSIRVGGGSVSNFYRVTGENVGRRLAVLYIETESQKQKVGDKIVTKNVQVEKVINDATIQQALGNSFQITGLSSMQYAENLALLLRSGAYSARMDFVTEQVIGPSLGKQNIEMGITSLEIGAALVFFFMLIYYRLFGFVADLALVLNVIFIVAVLSILGATLTLPGMAAIVLTVGMAVDANVLINERVREELRNGKSPLASINAGYDRAFSTIVDANVTTLIVAVILLALGSGPVQNFAVTLIIGIITSMFTAIFFTRAIINLIYGGRSVKRLSIGIKLKS